MIAQNKTVRNRKPDRDAEVVQIALARNFGEKAVQAYRFNLASIRVRVISNKFSNKSRAEREKIVGPILDSLPERIQRDIIMLLLLTPKEHNDRIERADLLDVEFDDSRRSGL